MDRINFSKNWNNKLFCESFSTIRLRDDERFVPGKLFEAVLMDGDKEVFSKKVKLYCINITKLDKLTEGMALIDTGMSKEKTIGMFNNMYKHKVEDVNQADFVHLIFGKP